MAWHSAVTSAAHRAAITFADQTAQIREAEARRLLDRVLRDAGCESARSTMRCGAFGPTPEWSFIFIRIGTASKPVTVAESLLEDGRYRNQFETGLSSGSRTAVAVARGGETSVPWPPFVASTLGVSNPTVCGLLARLADELPLARLDPSGVPAGRVLDSCVEAHVHGSIDLRTDVEMLVMDPAFEGTPTGDLLSEAGRTYEFPIRWHCRFRMLAQDVPDDFRGPAMRPLARRISPNGVLDAAIIGPAEATVRERLDDWGDWGSRDEILQHLKQLWHVLVHYGSRVRPPVA